MDIQVEKFDFIILEASPVAARVQVHTRITGADDNNFQLAGSIKGPYCAGARTLPATIPMKDASTSAQWQAETVIPDPCFWTAELPYFYRVELHVVRDGEIIHRQEESIAIQSPSTSTVFEPSHPVPRADA